MCGQKLLLLPLSAFDIIHCVCVDLLLHTAAATGMHIPDLYLDDVTCLQPGGAMIFACGVRVRELRKDVSCSPGNVLDCFGLFQLVCFKNCGFFLLKNSKVHHHIMIKMIERLK